MTKKLFQQYADLKRQEKEIAGKISEIAPLLLEELPLDKSVEVDSHIFTRASRKKWTYSHVWDALKEQIGVIEQKEQADGTAEFKETFYVICKEKK